MSLILKLVLQFRRYPNVLSGLVGVTQKGLRNQTGVFPGPKPMPFSLGRVASACKHPRGYFLSIYYYLFLTSQEFYGNHRKKFMVIIEKLENTD